jgi:hypothetical protein
VDETPQAKFMTTHDLVKLRKGGLKQDQKFSCLFR